MGRSSLTIKFVLKLKECMGSYDIVSRLDPLVVQVRLPIAAILNNSLKMKKNWLRCHQSLWQWQSFEKRETMNNGLNHLKLG